MPDRFTYVRYSHTGNRSRRRRRTGCRNDHGCTLRKPIDGPHCITGGDVLITEKQMKYDRESDRRVANHGGKAIKDRSHLAIGMSCARFRVLSAF